MADETGAVNRTAKEVIVKLIRMHAQGKADMGWCLLTDAWLQVMLIANELNNKQAPSEPFGAAVAITVVSAFFVAHGNLDRMPAIIDIMDGRMDARDRRRQ